MGGGEREEKEKEHTQIPLNHGFIVQLSTASKTRPGSSQEPRTRVFPCGWKEQKDLLHRLLPPRVLISKMQRRDALRLKS